MAIERPDPLSARHSVADLARIVAADEALIAQHGLTGPERAAVASHRAHVARKLHHGWFLDLKRQRGTLTAGLRALAHPWRLVDLCCSIAGDKLERLGDRWLGLRNGAGSGDRRFLLPPDRLQ